MKCIRLAFLVTMIGLTGVSLMAQHQVVCGPDPTCTPDRNGPSYPGTEASRSLLLNARGSSSPIQATAGPLQVPMIIGSQSYNYAIPILKLPGRAGMDLQLTLYYNSRVWNIDTANATATFNADRDFPSYGFRLDYGYLEYDPNNDRFILTERDGTKHMLPNTGGYNSSDGTYINYNSGARVLTYKNGTMVQYEPLPTTANLFRPTQIKDTNGNYISISYLSGHEQLIQSITDTLGRVINFHYDGSNQLSFIDQNVAVSTVDPTGVHRYVTFTWAQLYGGGYAWYNFSGLTVSGVPALATPLNVLSRCTYANNSGYRFTYGDWGIITKIEDLSAAGNTRSYISYNFPLAGSGALTDAPAYTQETFSPDGLTTNLSVWNYAATKAGAGVVTSMQVTDPTGAISVTNLDATTGLTSSVQKKNTSGTVLRTTSFAWTTSGGASVPATVTTVLNDTGQQSSVQYANYDAFGNAGDIYEYNFDGQLLRHTVTSYATTRFGPQHILNLPMQVLVKDASGATIVRTDLDYDTTSITSVADAANHDNSLLVHGNLTSITRYGNAATGGDPFARHFFYDSTGNVRTAELDCCNQKVFNFGVAQQYAYPTSIVRGPSGTQFTTSATYNFDKGLLLTSTDENNQVTQYQYDSMNRPTTITLPPQGSTSVQIVTAYDDNATSPTITKSSLPSSVTVPKTVTTMDGLGHVMQVDTKNGTTLVSSVKYTYDKLWRRTQTSNPFAPGETAVYTTTTYDALGRSIRVTPPSSGFTQYDYSGNATTITDPGGIQRRKYADALGRLAEVDEPGETFAGIAAQGSVSVNGTLRTTQTQAAAKATAQVSIGGFNRSVTTFPQCPPPPMICDQTPETIYDSGTVFITVNGHEYDHFYPLNANGDSSVEVAAGLVNAIQADPARVVNASLSGSVVILTAVNAGSAGNNIAFSSGSSYDTADFSVPSFTPSPASGHLAGGQDAVTGGTDAGTVSISVGGFTGTVCYGISTNPFCSGKPHYDNATAIASALVGTFGNSGATVHGSASAGIIQMTYNVVGMVGNTGVAINSTPDNASTFPGGSFSGFITLSGGQDPAPAGLAHPFITTYTYDAANNTTLISQAAGYVSGQLMPGQQRSFVHDGLGRLTSSTTPESGTVQQFYTPLAGFICGTGNPMLVCRTQDARGVVKNLSYDGINRLVGMQFTNTTGGPDPLGTPPVSYQYDAGGAAAFALDRITKITEGPATPTPVNSHTFTYDNWGRILTDTQSIDQKTYVVRYAYNLAGRISSITYPSGRVVLQNFDAIGRPCAVGASGSTCTTGTRYLNSLTYNAAGETLSFALGNGVQASFTYNDHLQLSTLRYFKGSSEILNLAYDYTTGVTGDNGQIQKMHYYTTPGVEDLTKSENFQYDNLGRLSAAQTGVVNSTAGAKTWSLTWSYDRFGNRTTQTMIGGDPTLPVAQPSLLFDPATNRITNSGYTYDAAGNMTHDATAAYTYDGANRLTKINTTAAVYSYFGPQRIKKVLGSTTTRYIYAGLVPIAEYVNGATTPSTEYIYSGSRLLVTISGSATTYHHPDHVSNRAETNSSGTKIRSAGNLPWGDPWYELTGTDKWKFSNYEHDSGAGETGLDYAGSRYYSSSLGRFLSPDRIPGRLHSPRSLNAYLYVGDDPVNISDPMGDFWFEQTFCVNTGSGDVCETEFQWIDLDEGGGGGGGFDPGGGDGGGGGGGGDDGNKNNQPTPQCTFVIGINNLAGLSDDVLKQLEAKIASLFGPSVGVTFVDGAGGQPGEGNFSGHVEGPGPSAPKADYQLNLTTSGFYWGSWFGNYGSTPGVIIHYGTPDVYTDTIRKEWPTDYADVFGISGAHELIHRITNWGDVSYNNNEPNDIMAINSNPNGLNPKTVALTDKEKAALLNDCLDKHK